METETRSPKTEESHPHKAEDGQKKQHEQDKTEKRATEKQKEKNIVLLFNRWDISGVKVNDPGLRAHINLEPVIVPRSYGRAGTEAFRKNSMNVVERLINKLMIPGHKGKKHKVSSGRCVGRTQALEKVVIEAFTVIEKRKKTNPVQVLVNAIENGAMIEEVTAYRVGGTIVRKHVVTSPHRRLDVALRHIAQGIYNNTFNSRKNLADAMADEIIAVADNDQKTMAVRERIRLEKEAEGAR